MSLRETLSDYWYAFRQELFPRLETAFGPLSGRYALFVAVVEFVRLEILLPSVSSFPGRPPQDRAALARAFMAKAVFDIQTTRDLAQHCRSTGRFIACAASAARVDFRARPRSHAPLPDSPRAPWPAACTRR